MNSLNQASTILINSSDLHHHEFLLEHLTTKASRDKILTPKPLKFHQSLQNLYLSLSDLTLTSHTIFGDHHHHTKVSKGAIFHSIISISQDISNPKINSISYWLVRVAHLHHPVASPWPSLVTRQTPKNKTLLFLASQPKLMILACLWDWDKDKWTLTH